MAGIAVMGAGILGLSAAFTLARRGAAVVVIEAEKPGAGASGGLVGALAPHAPEGWNAMKQFQLESLLASREFWADVASTGGVEPGYARLGRVQPLADEKAVVRARAQAKAAAQLWQGRAEWRVLPARDAPGLALESHTGLVAFDTLSARLAPRRALAALMAALAALGVAVEKGTTPPPNVRQVVWANGVSGLADLGAALGVQAGGPVKGQAALLAADWHDAPQIYAPGLHLVPHADGTLALGSTSEREFDDPAATDSQLDAVIAHASALCPALQGATVLERWAGLRPRARSRLPVLGPWPGRAGHFVLNGGFKTGFGMAPKLAEAMADLLLEGHDARPPGMAVEAILPSPRPDQP
ncbi:MAG: FAD-binding oxidoreductase [Pararhodobacter sp.]|nr:FAD-binding oxidoreductase [Pararhodobacter sp.]